MGNGRHEKKSDRSSVFVSEAGQVTMEFIFAILAVVMLIVGTVRVFSWAGRDLVARTIYHEVTLTAPITKEPLEPLKQLSPLFFSSMEVGAYVNNTNIFGREVP